MEALSKTLVYTLRWIHIIDVTKTRHLLLSCASQFLKCLLCTVDKTFLGCNKFLFHLCTFIYTCISKYFSTSIFSYIIFTVLTSYISKSSTTLKLSLYNVWHDQSVLSLGFDDSLCVISILNSCFFTLIDMVILDTRHGQSLNY